MYLPRTGSSTKKRSSLGCQVVFNPRVAPLRSNDASDVLRSREKTRKESFPVDPPGKVRSPPPAPSGPHRARRVAGRGSGFPRSPIPAEPNGWTRTPSRPGFGSDEAGSRPRPTGDAPAFASGRRSRAAHRHQKPPGRSAREARIRDAPRDLPDELGNTLRPTTTSSRRPRPIPAGRDFADCPLGARMSNQTILACAGARLCGGSCGG